MSFPWPTLELPQPLTGLAGGVCALWNQSSSGWVGIDFGVSSIKLAQLEKQGEFWRLKNCAILPLPAADTEAPQLLAEELANAALLELARSSGLGSTFSTQQAAAVASLGVLELRSFEAHDLGEGEPAEASEESLENLGKEQANWEIPAHLFHPSRGRQVMSAAMETAQISQFAEAVAQLGLDCCTLDVLPACLARSLALVAEPTQAAVAVLDLGFSHPSLTVCQEELPVYCRRLKHCGLGHLLSRLAAEFGLSHEECRALLTRFASCPAEGMQDTGKSFLSTALQAYLGQLKSELIRTLDYLESHRRESFPEQIILCGGGGTIAGLGDWLTGQIGIPAAPWTLAGTAREVSSGDHRLHPLFAAAAALSALAWEA